MRGRIFCQTAIATALAATSATAEQAPQAAALSEIVVTAQRKTENLQQVPISVAAIPQNLLKGANVTDPQTLTQFVPGLRMDRGGIALTPRIRGVGSGGVASYEDDIYSGTFSSESSFNNLAIDHIEVLKGPQGTLFGRDTTGGVIHILTKNPTHESRLDMEAGYANYRTSSGQFYATTGLSDTIAVNLAGDGYHQVDGWGRNVTLNKPTHDAWGWGVRGKLLWEPNDNTSVLISAAARADAGEQGMANMLIPGTFGRGNFAAPAIGFHDEIGDVDAHWAFFGQRGGLKVTHDFGWASFVSISGGTHVRAPNLQDFDAVPAFFIDVSPNRYVSTITQELQLVSPKEQRLQWILGGYYLRLRDHQAFNFRGAPFATLGTVTTTDQIETTKSASIYGQASAEVLPRTKLTLGLRYTRDQDQVVGYTGFPNRAPPIFNGPYKTVKRWHPLTGRVSLDYQVNPDLMVYGAFNRGYRSGNAGGIGLAATSLSPGANPEHLNAYTGGFKSEWFDHRLRVNAEAFYNDYRDILISVINLDLSGSNVPFSGAINAGKSHYQGIDIDTQFLATDNLTLVASLELMEGKFDYYPNGTALFPVPPNPTFPIPTGKNCVVPTAAAPGGPPIVQGVCDLTGNTPPGTPKWTLSLAANYKIPTSLGPVTIVGNYAHTARMSLFDGDNNPITMNGPTDLFNGSVTLSLVDGRYDIRLWGKNLTGEKYYSYAAQSTVAGYKYSAAPPRQYGFSVAAHF